MKTSLFSNYLGAALCACALLVGCETTPTKPEPPKPKPLPKEVKPLPPPVPTAPPSPAMSVEALILKEGIALFNNGEYNASIKRLGNASEIWNGSNKGVQVEALKYMAFSYCVTSRPLPCRQQFERALKLDPAFELAAGEKGHPQWGPVFARAQKTTQKPK